MLVASAISGLAVWIILILLLVLFKANRNKHALSVFVPVVLIALIWFAVKGFLQLNPQTLIVLNALITGLWLFLASLCLLAEKINNRNRMVTFTMALLLSIISGLITILVSATPKIQNSTIASFTVCYMASVLVILFGLVFAAWLCRKNYSDVKFTFLLIISCLFVGIILAAVYLPLSLAIQGGTDIPVKQIILVILSVGLMLGGISCLILLPFMIFVLRSPLFQNRFYACFRLPSMPAQTTIDFSVAASDFKPDDSPITELINKPQPSAKPDPAPRKPLISTNAPEKNQQQNDKSDDDDRPFYKR